MTQDTSPAVRDKPDLNVLEDRARLMFLAAAAASFVFSVTLWFTGSKEQGLFVGLWVPSILSLGALMLSKRGA